MAVWKDPQYCHFIEHAAKGRYGEYINLLRFLPVPELLCVCVCVCCVCVCVCISLC